jgi:hypothetical protein
VKGWLASRTLQTILDAVQFAKLETRYSLDPEEVEPDYRIKYGRPAMEHVLLRVVHAQAYTKHGEVSLFMPICTWEEQTG